MVLHRIAGKYFCQSDGYHLSHVQSAEIVITQVVLESLHNRYPQRLGEARSLPVVEERRRVGMRRLLDVRNLRRVDVNRRRKAITYLRIYFAVSV